ncbi:hypothetical protein [Microscilla marina]|uniref:YcxB-like protein domain-containing protein n=1 Tax=Microscilla marina ATCC 23134 TaxID=313606 RepID=A1ZPV3_MICM2|nr:hypothetical protein [Microscilla marina]EAY27608.1 hypothetical protein M23134_02855 [Microscilla marina ATCC 23134]
MSTHKNKDHYIEIPLNFDVDHFWEIYNEQWQDEIILIDRRHSDRFYLGRILTALFIFGFIMAFINGVWAFFIGVGIVLSVGYQVKMANDLQAMQQKLDNKRADVEKWLDDLKTAHSFRLLLTPDYFTLFQDETPHQMPWEKCQSFAANENYLMIIGQPQEPNFIFPRKSMKEADFFTLTRTVEEKILS